MPFGAKKAAAGLAGLTPEQLYQQAKEQFDGPDGPEKWRGVRAACQQLLGEAARACPRRVPARTGPRARARARRRPG